MMNIQFIKKFLWPVILDAIESGNEEYTNNVEKMVEFDRRFLDIPHSIETDHVKQIVSVKLFISSEEWSRKHNVLNKINQMLYDFLSPNGGGIVCININPFVIMFNIPMNFIQTLQILDVNSTTNINCQQRKNKYPWNIRFRGKLKSEFIENLDGHPEIKNGMDKGYITKMGWVEGNLICGKETYIIGDVVEACEEYFAPLFWYKVDPISVELISGENNERI